MKRPKVENLDRAPWHTREEKRYLKRMKRRIVRRAEQENPEAAPRRNRDVTRGWST